jgi:hypothetical protein
MVRPRKILSDLFDSFNYTYNISRVEELLNNTTVIGYKLHTCDTMHLRKGKVITISGNSFTIKEVLLNKWIRVDKEYTIATSLKTFTTYPFYFFSGTLRDTQTERIGAKQVRLEQVPFMWVKEPYEQRDNEEENAIESVLSTTFYLLDTCQPVGVGIAPNEAWQTEDHHTDIIEPMQNFLEKRIMTKIKTTKNIFGDIESKTVRGLVFVGSQDNNGNFESLFSERLSGIEVRIELPIKRGLLCDC